MFLEKIQLSILPSGLKLCVTALILALAIVSGCDRRIYIKDGVTDGNSFYVPLQAIKDDSPSQQSWIAYSLARSVCQLEIGGENPARNSSYDCELSARHVLVTTWRKHNEMKPEQDSYLDQLSLVNDAGYLDEYVWFYLKRDSWQAPSQLDSDEFKGWKQDALHGHTSMTRIIGSWNYMPKKSTGY